MDTLTRMRAFKDVVESEGYSAASRRIGRSKALLSKYVRELEDELSTLLINRTTRQFSLTDAGHQYYARVVDILRDIDDLQDIVRQNAGDLRGRIRVSAPRTLADSVIGQAFADFVVAHPEITLDIALDDRFVDLVSESFDMAIRIAEMEDSSLIARRIGDFTISVYASPAFYEQAGRPDRPEQLVEHPCIIDSNARGRNLWTFALPDGSVQTLSVPVLMSANSPEVVRRAAVSGLGFAVIPDLVVRDDYASGKLIRLFPQFMPNRRGIFAVYPHRRHQPARVRTLVDFLSSWMRHSLPRQTADR